MLQKQTIKRPHSDTGVHSYVLCRFNYYFKTVKKDVKYRASSRQRSREPKLCGTISPPTPEARPTLPSEFVLEKQVTASDETGHFPLLRNIQRCSLCVHFSTDCMLSLYNIKLLGPVILLLYRITFNQCHRFQQYRWIKRKS